ncbi:MAG: endonuclease/exonuclease/phosphatase family protein [Selenomonas sp.]|uniref:endonuclease/exonuclease/phosphatase family protein n=1 Tax=Selenomonas sp. TaxID=2053611 RepID=UPI0025CEA2FE|nr:endonuclease/exonuclease/phosphatase family protein [Selenomonas sp.]MCI6099327.1 endonuclease/exonuclease/phosphatase family protein [Selenomonas sp.]MCI6233372.1 endonuclease/exonuclease/phosphatase family protein [Selenomonas sp.]
MRIATWNVERLSPQKRLTAILENLHQVNADVLVLTETDMRIRPEYAYAFHTPLLTETVDADYYRPTENRVSIFTKYSCIRKHPVADGNTSLCVELETESGPLVVYGTIFGIYGNRRPSFQKDIREQMEDVRRLTGSGHALCLCGDFNCSFSDNYYFTNWARETLKESFTACDLELMTATQPECIDHIALSRNFPRERMLEVREWNLEKRLSDHKGIYIDF